MPTNPTGEDFPALARRATALADPVPADVVAKVRAALRPHRDKFPRAVKVSPHPPHACDDTAIEDAERSGRTIPHIGADAQCQCTCPWCNNGSQCICPDCTPFDHEHLDAA